MTNEEINAICARAEAEYEWMKDRLHDLNDENKQLKEQIHKAIEYIKEHKEHEYRNGNDNEYYLELNENKMNELLEILGGNNENIL